MKEETSSISIRKATHKDMPIIKECLIDSWVEHAKAVPKLLDEERMRNSKVDEYYQKCFDEPDKCFVFVAEIKGEFAGFIRADRKKIANFFKHSETLWLDDTYVLPSFRRQGVAHKLTLEVETLASELGIKRIQSRIYTFNKPMQKLRSSMGYSSPHATWDKVLE